VCYFLFFFSSRRRHTRFSRDWSSDVCSSDLFDLRYAEFLPSPPEMAGDEQVPGYPFILPYGRDIGPGVFGRRHWTILGWELRSRSEERRVGKEGREV